MKSEREIGLDALKVFAFFCVASLHICASVWYDLPVRSMNWQIINFLRGTWCVPVFVMITGRFLLDPERTVNTGKLKKYIKRIVVAFLIWSAIYQVYHILSGSLREGDWKDFIVNFVSGEYHMWYLYMLIGLYLVTPFLRMIVRNQKLMKYFLILFFIFECLNYCAAYAPKAGIILTPILENSHINIPLGYTGYFVLGYYIYQSRNAPFWKENERWIYLFGACLMLLSGAANGLISIMYEKPTDIFTKYEAPNVILYSAAIYLFFVRKVSKWNFLGRLRSIINQLADYGLGAYLVHVMIINILIRGIGILPLALSPLIMVPVLTVLVVFISYCVIAFIARIPLVKNYLL